MLEQKPLMDKLALPTGTSPEKTEQHSERKIQDEGSKWKSKSLNSMPTQHYQMDIRKSAQPRPTATTKQSKKTKEAPQQSKDKKPVEGGQKILPQPKIKKINEKMFCIIIDNLLKVFYNRIRPKTSNDKNSFDYLNYEISNNINFVAGNGSNFIFIGTENELIILCMERKEDKYFIVEKTRKQIPQFRAVTFIGDEIVAVSNQIVYQFSLVGNFDLVGKMSIQFSSQTDKLLFHELKPINLIVESGYCFYFFGSKIQEKIDYTSKRKFNIDTDAKPPSKMSQVLHIVKFLLQNTTETLDMYKSKLEASTDQEVKKTRYVTQTQLIESKISSIQIQIFPIDHVFEVGIFDKSKIYELDENIFLMSMHEEIILIRKHFKKFIVWDNVSIVSSKSQEKKGQLILADKRVLVYSENGQIFAHDIYFNEEESRINMPPIDSFRGNDNDQEILYDALLLEYDKNSLMKVLFYFKEIDVILPNKSKFRKQPDNPNEQQHDENKLSFTMLCINQYDPQQKLKQMLRQKKPPNEVVEFCQRFNINTLQKIKCQWSVSDKSLKDIENVLLQISDDSYIQTELDNILKKEPHNLTFLISVEKKQIARLKKLIVRNLLNDNGASQVQIMSEAQSQGESGTKRRQYVKKVIQWLMESIMFEKKLEYSKNFLSFKEYDFIEIGKLKAASLKEEIKLLSCKKYEKRLKYFLNSFRVLAIANWQEIFTFLLQNKTQLEIKQFLVDFSFILPKFTQSSGVFQEGQEDSFSINKKTTNLADFSKESMKNRQLALREPQNGADSKAFDGQDDKCYLWTNLLQVKTIMKEGLLSVGQQKIAQSIKQDGQAQLNTVEDFQRMIIESIISSKKDQRTQNEAINNFKELLSDVTRTKWFDTAAFKQHSMLNRTSQQLQQQFLQLKNKKAYQILVKYLFRQIQTGNTDISQNGIRQMLKEFVQEKMLIPLSFMKNDQARLKVYDLLTTLKNSGKIEFVMQKSEFLVLNEDSYFSKLFDLCRPLILTQIKKIYDDIKIGFFRERFQMFLESKLINLQNIIKFVDFFQKADADDVRIEVFNCIKKLLKITDQTNTRDFIEKSLEKEVLPQRSNEINNSNSMGTNLRQQAKIPYGFVFHKFYQAFRLDYTYQQLIQATKHVNLATNTFLQELIRKYCKSQYEKDKDYNDEDQCLLEFEDNKILNEKLRPINIHNRPLEFFGLFLYLVDVLDFEVVESQLYELMIENYLNEGMINEQNIYNNGMDPESARRSPGVTVNASSLNKFEELWGFVKSLDNYIMTGEDLSTRNYGLINSFKEDHDPEQIFVDYTINWIGRKYSEIKTREQIQPTLIAVKKVLEILQRSNRSAKNIKKMDAFYRLLEFLKKFNNDIMMKIDYIKKQQEEHSGFIFLIHMFRQIGVENFISARLEDRGRKAFDDNHKDTQTKRDESTQQTNTKIYNWMCIYSQYKIIRGEDNIDEKDNPEFIRFIVEICCFMIHEEKYEIAWDLLLRAVNQAYYFRDAFYYLASRMKIENREQFRESFRSFLSTETAKNLKQKLNIMIKGNMEKGLDHGHILSFPPQRLNKSGQKTQNNSIFLFKELVDTNRADEGFFFLVRIKRIRNSQIQGICQDSKRMTPLGLKSYLLLTAYMKCLEKYISDEFYPTFLFFRSKYEILIDNIERKDIIKDINIAISRLKFRISEQTNQALKKDITECKDELQRYYNGFMKFIHEDPVIRLTQEDQQQATKRIQMYARITPDILEDETKQEATAKLKLQENQQKLQKVHENNKLNVIHKEINESVTEAKKAADKYAAILEEKKKQASKMTYAEKKEMQLMQIKRKQDQDVSSIKDTFRSNTTQKVNELIDQLRKKRQKINESRYKSSMIRQEDQRPNLIIPQKDIPGSYKKIETKELPQSKYNVQISPIGKPANLLDAPQNYGIGNRASQIIENAKKSYIGGQKPSQKFAQMQKNIKRLEQPTLTRVKVTSDQINELFKTKQPEGLKYLEKFDLIKQNMQVAVQLVKRVFSVVKDLTNFMQFMRYLFGSDERYKQVLEEKSIAIVTQMIKMDQKINLKELVPVELFIQVHSGMSLKDYYFTAYEVMKPNLKKILAQEKIAAHALGILMRYSLGSETKYFHRVFADYISVLLKTYENKVFDEKETFLLAEKLRSQFTNLEPENREFLFEKLVNQITNEAKRKKLIDGLKKALQRKTDSAIGGGQIEEIGRALTRLEKK